MVNNNNNLNDNLLWAVSEPARQLVSKLVKGGLDPDLALALVERIFPEDYVYNLEDGDDHG